MADIHISLTRFVDFVIKAGSPRYTSLKETKQQTLTPYSPATDYYKQLREAIVEFHRFGKPISSVEQVATKATDKRREATYSVLAVGYKKFLGRKTVTWFTPPSANWMANGVSVSINPELGLGFGDKKHVVKLYFKPKEPSKHQVKAILALMDDQLQDTGKSRTMAILDIRRSKLITDTPCDPRLLALMRGEAAAIAAIWPTL
jgi:hypothetical protein